VTDIYDRASELEEMLREIALQEQQHRAKIGDAGQWDRLSATHCSADDCGVPIPKARRQALPGVQFCVDCQQLKERRIRL